MFLFAVPLMAATTASFSPATVNVTPGEKFDVVVTVNPQGVNNLVEKLEINYPADTLKATSFAFGNTWMALPGAGYDSIDNTSGVLIKTAGYPKGITSSTVFGTISFTAKKEGSGVIKIGSNSLAFEAKSQTAITGNDASFTVTAPAVVPVTPTPTPAPKTTPQVTQPTQPTTQPVENPAPQTTPTSENNLVASAGTATTTSGWAYAFWTLLALVVIYALAHSIYYIKKSKQK